MAKKKKAKKAAVKKSPAKKKLAAKKPAAKKAPAKKATAKKAPAKKAPAKKAAAKKAPAKKTPAKKTPVAKKTPAAAKKAVPKKKSAAKKKPVAVEEEKPKPLPKTPFKAKELREFKQLLLNLRDRIVDEIAFLAGDNLNRSQSGSASDLSSHDQGTDNFDREFALNLVSTEQDILHEIDAALRRIDNKSYGVCQISGNPIEKERLKVIPHARNSVKAQSELERGKTKYRPFGPTISKTH